VITSYKDCVATVVGLENAMSGELVYIFPQDSSLDLDKINSESASSELSIGIGFQSTRRPSWYPSFRSIS
jgi:hypothetical protein